MSTDLTNEQIKKLLQGISIPPQPQIMVDLQMEQMSPDCNINRIAQLISQDMGLSGSILKTVNSAHFNFDTKITSILQACNLLGINSVVNIVNTLSIRGELSDENIVALNLFWDSAMDVAMTCASIAKQLDFDFIDEAYTLGLFHNCAIPLLMQRFDNYEQILCNSYKKEDPRLIDVENESCKSNHAVVGYYIAKSWNLPSYMCEAIADHHSAETIFSDPYYPNLEKKNLLAVLKIAEHICGLHKTLGDQELDHEWMRIEDSVLDHLNLSLYDYQAIRDVCAESGLSSSNYICAE